jgi:drug/metabolite transporter (DMT)-like permease
VRLSIYTYLQPVIQFVFDLTLLHTTFAGLQIVGIGIVFVANVLVLGKTIKNVLNMKEGGPPGPPQPQA